MEMKKSDAGAAFDPAPFLKLLNSKEDARRVFQAVEDAIFRSFGQDQQRSMLITIQSPTKDEVRRRTKMCVDWFRKARGDLGFSLQRTLDLMPHALRCTLDGREFDPDASPIWTPT